MKQNFVKRIEKEYKIYYVSYIGILRTIKKVECLEYKLPEYLHMK